MNNNKKKTNISVVIPLLNEEESLGELLRWIDRVMAKHRYTYEVIFVDDGSKDGSWAMIESLGRERRQVRGIRFRRNYGKSAALYCGFDAAEGDVVITMDADLQDSPEEIPELYRMVTEEGYDMVSGWKRKRHDPLTKTIPSKIYNATARAVSGVRLHDMNCGLKAYRNKVVKSIEVYGEMHRYIPILAKWAGFTKIGEKEVQHRARKYGKSKFGWGRMIKGYLDLITVMFTSKFGKNPMYFFGSLGTLMFVLGGGTAIYLIAEKIYKQAHLIPVRGVTDQPLFYIAILAVILGVMLFLAGFLGELINRSSSDRNRYLIDDVLDGHRNNGHDRTQAADASTGESQESPRGRRGARCEPRRQMPLTAADARANVPDESKRERGSKPADKSKRTGQSAKSEVSGGETPGDGTAAEETRKRSRRRRGRGKSSQSQEGTTGTAIEKSEQAETDIVVATPVDAHAETPSGTTEETPKSGNRSRSRRRPKPQQESSPETGSANSAPEGEGRSDTPQAETTRPAQPATETGATRAESGTAGTTGAVDSHTENPQGRTEPTE